MDFFANMLGHNKLFADDQEEEGGDDFFAGMDADDRARTTEAAASLSAEQLNRLMEIFKTHDADGSGEFDVHELRGAMKDLGTDLTLPEAEKLIALIDESGDGLIQFWEFLEFFKPQMQGQGVGNIDEIVKATLVKKSMHIEDEFKEMHSLSSTTDRLNEAREEVRIIEEKLQQLKDDMQGKVTRQATRLRADFNRSLLIARDKADTLQDTMNRLKRKFNSNRQPKPVSSRKLQLYRAVDRDLELGVQMADGVQNSLRLCAGRMQELRKMQKKEKELKRAEDIAEIHKKMADLLAEIRERADDIDSNFDELEEGSIRVRKYWFKQLQMDLHFAKNDMEMERQDRLAMGSDEV